MQSNLKILLPTIAISLFLGWSTAKLTSSQPSLATASTITAKANLAKMLPTNTNIETIRPSEIPGIFLATTNNARDYYIASDGDFLMIGNVYDVERGVNLSDERANEKMAEAVANVPDEDIIKMGEPLKRYITVFTDTDCVYCQRFHQEVDQLQAGGLQVHYLMFPRAGLNSDSYKEAVSVWCADNQGAAMTVAKSGSDVPSAECDNPVAAQYELGQKVGVSGTPTMVLDNGEVIRGYLPAKSLLERAGLGASEG